MPRWKQIADHTKKFLETNDLSNAEQAIICGLDNFPNQFQLLVLASNIYSKSGDHEKSLEYANFLITHHPQKWDGHGRAAQALVVLKRFEEAKQKVEEGLLLVPNRFQLLVIASDVYRKSGDHEKSLEYANLLILHHPQKWNGHGRAAQDLVSLKRLEEAKQKVAEGLLMIPNQVNLLLIASDIYRKSGDREKSLGYANLLATHHPHKWDGYGRASQDLVALERIEEARQTIEAGLANIPNHVNLLAIATDIYRALGEREKSLKHAELLITHHPENWQGYIRASQDKLSLGKFNFDVYQDHLPSCPIPQSGYRQFWNSLHSSKNTLKRNLWINSFKINRQSTDSASQSISTTWQPFQFWSQGEPPKQITMITLIWNEIFSSIGIPPIKLFDQRTALQYIENNCPELTIPFKSAFHFAVEADVFRLAFAQKNNCIWLDSDMYPKIHTKHLLEVLLRKQRTTLFFRSFKPWIANGFFITHASSTFFKQILNSTKNIDFSTLPKNATTVSKSFGPGRYNFELDALITSSNRKSTSNSNADLSHIDGMCFVNEHSFAHVAPPYRLEYKNTNCSWQKFLALP